MAIGEIMNFTKMQGAGNDYIYVDCFKEHVESPEKLAPIISDRHYGVGGDGLILIMPSEKSDVRMRIFNADGSEAQMCGNGIRCVARFAHDRGICEKDIIRVETLAGEKTVKLFFKDGLFEKARVDMGVPDLRKGALPMSGYPEDEASNIKIEALDLKLTATCVSIGNPHCVIFVDDVDEIPLENIGPAIENHEVFPERINVHFVQIIAPGEVRVRTWERGSGITLACGTGACAVCVVGAHSGRTERSVLAHLPGGDLELDWASNGHVYMTGPAEEVFRGEWLV